MGEYREIVIKIPEEIISFVNCNGFLPENYRSAMGRVLLDGVELPKGHVWTIVDTVKYADTIKETEPKGEIK